MSTPHDPNDLNRPDGSQGASDGQASPGSQPNFDPPRDPYAQGSYGGSQGAYGGGAYGASGGERGGQGMEGPGSAGGTSGYSGGEGYPGSQPGAQAGQGAGESNRYAAGNDPLGSQGAGPYGDDPYAPAAGGDRSAQGDPSAQDGQYAQGDNPYAQGDSYAQAGQYAQQGQYAHDGQYAQSDPYAGSATDQADPYAAGYAGGPGAGPSGTDKNWMGLTALITGIAGFFTSGLGSIAAIIFGFMGLSAAKKGQANNRGMSLTGVILGFVFIALWIIAWILIIVLVIAAGSQAGSSAIPNDQPQSSSTAGASPGSGSTAGGSGSGSSDGAAGGSTLTLADGLTMTSSVRTATVSQSASPANVRGKSMAVVTMRLKNASSSSITPASPIANATVNGASAPQVFDRSLDETLGFSEAIPAHSTKTIKVGFAPVTAAQLNDLKVTLKFAGTSGDAKGDFTLSAH
ncbi:DUF4190 domain-containing protein [Brevibacterium sp. 5221]|uniref:DUF4190 domain-containing protein n=1 Tax=Brevibacterium rongguiense TaxID=2695267 RepID=A0A6N9HAL1_9MICO|nr:DUF4190 domain-containing protein [Brevibacterium rongguiense]MYM20544.1 DUF4190 domain-containing protein [Brevibacterium rongguiense]